MRANRVWSVRIGVIILVLFVLMAIVGPWLVGDPNATSAPLNSPPTGANPLGTTNIGQDVLTQLVVGARGSLAVATLAAVIATVAAIAVGVTGAVLGGVWDDTMSLFTNAMLVIPTLPLVVVIAGYVKNAGGVVVAIVIAVTGWSWSARIFRAQTLSLRRRDFVLAARASGEGAPRIVVFEVLPHLVPLIAAQFLGIVLYAIMTQAGLAFLGIGAVTDWTWGTMLYWANSAQAFQLGYWWWYVPPGLCIALFGTALVLLNSAIDAVADNRAEQLPRRSWLRRPVKDSAQLQPVAGEIAA
ncbi:MAG TPA: ABC transporter permease [Streptosporangiaceae bacterium]|nr:ABC transporter permease [Streptosporangiaceae bacterium]